MPGVLILWGYNPSFTPVPHATAAVAGMKRGMRLIVVDPRQAGLASKADVWLRVRPGTDGALALGLAHLMIERGWYDRDFVREWSNGPHLVRADNGRLLTGPDLGSADDDGPVSCLGPRGGRCRMTPRQAGTTARAPTSRWKAEYRIATSQGEIVCHPGLRAVSKALPPLPPATVESITWIPPGAVGGDRAALVARAARVLLRV